ncbi:MAG TPA: VCBS repeat-containing protein, partial [Candidatus Binatia bacterium]|nr:VCBS repeat-containing protein [Candidatus Binatia bacterium]
MRPLRTTASLVSFALLILASHPTEAAYPRPLFRAPACLVDVDKPTPAQGEFVQHVTVAEWTGDDLKDLIVTLLGYDGASNAMYDVRFFKNVMATGNPRTFEPVPAPAGFNPPASVVEVLAGDLNGDGRADLVMTDTTTTVWVQLSTGSGLGAAATYIYGPSTKIIRASLADMDQDGRLDVVVHTHNVMTHIEDVSILRNTGGGTLDPQPLLSVGTDAIVGLGDLNVDGRPDVIGAGSGQCTVYLSSGPALGFAAPYSVPTAATPLEASVANVSDDGNPDLVLLYDNTLEIHHGTGGGLIASSGTSLNLGKAQACGMTAANLDADAQTELVITHQPLSHAQADPHGTVEILDFVAPTIWLSTGPLPGSDPVVANLDRDGQLDLVVPSSGHQVAVLFGALGSGTGIEQVIGGPAPTMFGTPAVGDFNRDGKPDVAASMGGSTRVLMGNGAGGFPTTLSMSAVGGDNLFPCDMNRDGKQDLLEASGREYRMRLGNGDGTFAPPF